MNPFRLFETKNIEDIKLGLQVVKTLGLQREFREYFKKSRANITFEDYSENFDRFYIKDNSISDIVFRCYFVLYPKISQSTLYEL